MTVRLRFLSALALPAVLAACATPPPATALKLRPAIAAPEAPVDALSGATPYGLYLSGEAAIRGGSSHDAAIYFGRASRLEPDDGPLQARAFSAALIAGDVAAAAKAAERLPQTEGAVAELGRLTRAVEALAEDRPAEALSLLPTTGGHHAVPALLLKPWAAAAAGDWKTAVADPEALADPVDQSVAELAQAELLERSGRFADAETLYTPRAHGRSSLFILSYGAFLERRGRTADAQALYDRAIADNPTDPALRTAKSRLASKRPPPPLPSLRQGAAEALIAPAALMLARREGDNGLSYLRLALRLDPHLDEAWVLVGDAMNGGGDTDAAAEAYGKVRADSDQYVAARSRLALLAQQAGDKAGALRLARETIEASPKDNRSLVLYADLLRDDGRYAEAVSVLDRAIARADGSEPAWSFYYVRGVAKERAGDWTGAEADLKQAMTLKPDEAQVLNYLGYAWADRGEHLKEALAMLEKAAVLEPRSGAILDSLGWARYRVRQYPDALRYLERAVLLAPSDPDVNNHLGDAYWRVGRKLEARFQWRRVLSLDADPKTRSDAEAKLARGLTPDGPAAAPAAMAPGKP